jgi:hypothetical protein
VILFRIRALLFAPVARRERNKASVSEAEGRIDRTSRTHPPFKVQAWFATFPQGGASHESAVDGKLEKVQ